MVDSGHAHSHIIVACKINPGTIKWAVPTRPTCENCERSKNLMRDPELSAPENKTISPVSRLSASEPYVLVVTSGGG